MKDPQREGAVVKPHGTSHDVLDCSCGLGRDCAELPLHGGPVELVTRVQTFVGGTRFFFFFRWVVGSLHRGCSQSVHDCFTF